MEIKLIIDFLGWLGTILVLGAYFAVSTKRMHGSSTAFQIMNLIGGACLLLNTIYYGAYPSSALNLVWIGIATYALVRS